MNYKVEGREISGAKTGHSKYLKFYDLAYFFDHIVWGKWKRKCFQTDYGTVISLLNGN